MKTVDTYKGIEITKGFRNAFTISNGTKINSGKKFKNMLDSISYEINGKEYSFSLSKGADYLDYKETTRQEIDMRIRRNLPKL